MYFTADLDISINFTSSASRIYFHQILFIHHSPLSQQEKIEIQKEQVSKTKDRYEAELAKLEKLMRKRDELRSKELMDAFTNSERSFEEVMRFLAILFILLSLFS